MEHRKNGKNHKRLKEFKQLSNDRNVSMWIFQLSIFPTFQHSNIPTFQFSIFPFFQFRDSKIQLTNININNIINYGD